MAFPDEALDELLAAGAPEAPPPLTEERVDDLLHRHHPDYQPEGKRVLSLGANRGAAVPARLADLLEGRPRIAPRLTWNRPDRRCDVLVIGGGGAGATSALAAHDAGADTVVATKLRLGDSNTVMAEGGLQAAVGTGDDPARHFLDALRGGHFANDRTLLRALVEEAPATVAWLGGLGVRWDRDETGHLVTRQGGGTTRPRLLACADYTGLDIMRALTGELRGAGIEVLEFHPAAELLTDGHGRVTGAVLEDLDDGQITVVAARQVVLATGGAGRLHLGGAPTSNHYGATGDGLVLAYRAGCRLVHPESFQYHPTGIAYPTALAGALLTEGLRSAGAWLRNRHGERFVDELLPRDVVAAALLAEGAQGRGVALPGGGHAVWLDARHVADVRGRFPSVCAKLERVGIDPQTTPVLTAPTLHYQNGGARVDVEGQTDRVGLRACGEIAGGAHGTNRLMGNALLEVIAAGRRAGRAAAAAARETEQGDTTLNHLQEWRGTGPAAPVLLPDYVGHRP